VHGTHIYYTYLLADVLHYNIMQYRPQTVQTANVEDAKWLDAKFPAHKVLIYLEYHSTCPLVRFWTPTPSLASECVPSHGTKGGGTPSPADEGVGSLSSDDWRKSLELCLLCGPGVQCPPKIPCCKMSSRKMNGAQIICH
jgi:hypothetical protein